MPESLKDLSDAAQAGIWHTVDTPWGNGDWIVAGNPDPHAGQFVCLFDGSLIGVEADGSFHADPAENAAFVADLVNAYRAGRLHDDTALATAVARARREALDEAAEHFDWLAEKARARQMSAVNFDDLHIAIRAASAAADAAEQVRSLAATPPEDRQTETENRDRIIERLNRLAKDAWVGSVEEWTAQAVMAMCAASRFLSASPPPAIGNLDGEGRS